MTLLTLRGSDGVVVVWDFVAESRLFRLPGHHGPITQLHFVSSIALITAWSDGLVEVWDLQIQCSVQTIATLRGESWASSLLFTAEQSHGLFVGERHVRVWNGGASQGQ
jgi:WD40 repeat protein